MYQIAITKALTNDFLASYKGKLYLEEPVSISTGLFYGGEETLNLNEVTDVRFDFSPVAAFTPTLSVVPIKVEGIIYIYAKNPKQGALIIVTKILD